LSTLKKERYVFNEETNQQQETMIIDDSYIMLYYCLSTMNHRNSSTLGILAALAIGMVVIFASPLSASGNVGMTSPLQQQGVTSFPGQYGDGMNKPGEYAAVALSDQPIHGPIPGTQAP
jgi:hypothetical protein